MIKTANYSDSNDQIRLADASPMQMEQYERRHLEDFYQSNTNQLLCWGEESTYLDSEFYAILEKADQGNSSFWF